MDSANAMPSTERKCKLLYMHRCLVAMGCSILMQLVCFGVFLLSVNVHIFHFFGLITKTDNTVFSFGIWSLVTHLLWSVSVYGMLLARSHLAIKRYYATRYMWLKDTALQKVLFLATQVSVGCLSFWMYGNYFPVDYRFLEHKCLGVDCINSKYLFLMGAGIAAGCCHFLQENLKKDPAIEFPVIQEPRLARLRSLFYGTFHNTHKESYVPLSGYIFIYWLLGDTVNQFVARRCNVYIDMSLSSLVSVVTSPRLLFYAWILMSQILCNLKLTQQLFNIMLSEEEPFPIEKSFIRTERQQQVSLVEALAMSKIPVVKNLAILEVYKISAPHARDKRCPLFTLSFCDGHPRNWNQLYPQCLRILNDFIEELRESMKNITTLKSSPPFCGISQITAAEVAEKMLLRQYNMAYGIRHMVYHQPSTITIKEQTKTSNRQFGILAYALETRGAYRIKNFFNNISEQIEKALDSVFYTFPGLFYMFGEADDGRTTFLLAHSEPIAWMVQGLAGIFAASLTEDRYGVVQSELPQIIRTLLTLRSDLDKLTTQNLYGKKVDCNLTRLLSAVTRSLYQIITTFANYLPDMFDDKWELGQLQCFVDYRA